MSDYLDMSLAEIIRRNRISGGQIGRFRSKNTAPGPDRREPHRELTRMAPYTVNQNTMQPTHVIREIMMPSRGVKAETEKRIYISNLDYGVTDEDIELLFSDVGTLESYSVHYDRSGRSKGTGEVVYSRQIDALAAVKRFNNMHLDGKPLKLELVGEQLIAPDPLPPTKDEILENPDGGFRNGQDIEGAKGWVHGGAHGTSGVGRGSGRGRWQRNLHGKKLAADLDAELEEYLSKARRLK